MNHTKNKRTRLHHIIAALFLIIFISMVLFFTTGQIYTISTNACYRTLRHSTRQLSRDIKEHASMAERDLQNYASYLALANNWQPAAVCTILSAFDTSGIITELAVLFPDNHILYADGTTMAAADTLDFDTQASQGIHISRRQASLKNPDKLVLRFSVPVVQNGQITALLYGIVDLAHMASLFPPQNYAENARLSVLEGTSGDFILDTVHPTLGNTIALRDRTPNAGYSHEQVSSDIAAGKSGHTSFYSYTFGEFMYCDYTAVGINDWMILLALPEHVALQNADKIQQMLYLLAFLESVLLIAYFVWLLFCTRKESTEKERLLNRAQYMLDIENTLLGASRNPALIEEALHKVADMMTAQNAFLVVCSKTQQHHTYFWNPQSQWNTDVLCSNLLALSSQLQQGGYACAASAAEITEKYPAQAAVLTQMKISNFMLVPILNDAHACVGTFGVSNFSKQPEDAGLLHSVMLSFLMVLSTMESFLMIKEMGMLDALTGLLNRNCFQRAMEQHEQTQDDSLACVYVDVDGLHEMNNQCGHISGDHMLKAVANTMKDEFGADNTYRIGGDEFLSFVSGFSEEQMYLHIKRLTSTLEAQDYHISLGLAWRKNIPLVYDLVKAAETKMYHAKSQYYRERDAQAQARTRNEKLEDILTEKRDLDIFRSVLSSKYVGVYIVNLHLDTMRYIYIPSYFAEEMRKAGGKFSIALQGYAEHIVLASGSQEFLQFADFKRVEELLDRGQRPDLYYEKQDGSHIRLRIYRSPEYTPQVKECIWTFEKCDVTE